MQRICLFPGTFDPITLGHVDIINRAASLFDKLYIGIGLNTSKQPMFSIEQRKHWMQDIFKQDNRIEVISYEGLTINYCQKLQAKYILRGIRSIGDFEFEKAIGDMNRMLAPDIETIFLACAPEYSTISSTVVRDVIRNHGDVSKFIPKEIQF
ncbi:MAG TPA: pantetheine-phosphate adenylyltransferase [Flavipsychrobacter sp.]|jgi:pantetheine-phosphate adenylyltransferase|nr:pantetheine-phosphate adenylyltransferase [Flavipsychrobacter sp.]